MIDEFSSITVITSDLTLPTTNETYGTVIAWNSSNTHAISHAGVYAKPYVDTNVTLTAEVSYQAYSDTVTFNMVSKRYYSDLTDGVSMSYMYYSNSTASNKTYQDIDIVIFAHATAAADGTIANLSTLNSYLPSRVANCHAYGTYAILSFFTDNLSTIAADNALRITFANNIVNAINSLNLDGVDIDWEFPASAEAPNYTLLMKEIYNRVKANNSHHLVITATGIDTYTRYDLTNSIQYLDYVNIMTYDMHSTATATHHSALNYKSGYCYKAISNAYTYYVTNLGLDPNKLILGIPFYGRVFTNTNGLGTAATYDSSISYASIVSTYLSNPNYSEYWDSNCQAPYLYSAVDRKFISYDNPTSIALKVKYAADKGFAGVMYWQDAQDSGDVLFNALINGMNDNKISFSANIGLLALLIQGNKSIVLHRDVNYGGSVTNEVYGSVNTYSTDSIVVDTSKKIADGDLGSDKTYGLMNSLKFIAIHDTGNTASGSTALANTNYMINTPNVSWHYTVGDDSIYYNIHWLLNVSIKREYGQSRNSPRYCKE